MALASAACGATSTTAPSPAGAASACVLTLSGQSHARDLRPDLDIDAAAVGCTINGWAEGGSAIVEWAPTSAGWLGWVQPALQAPNVKGFIWAQGDADTGSAAQIAAYPAALRDLMTRAIAATHQPDLRIVIVEVIAGLHGVEDPGYDAIRSIQEGYARDNPDVRLVSTLDLPLGPDGGHFTDVGYVTLAQRIINAVH